MPRRPRCDEPYSWHHVMNRGLARRTVFESREDIRYFLSRLAHAVRRGQIEVHAFCVMTTHFHLLVRSPDCKLSEAMRRVQNEYVRRFNRTRHRDGPLFRGRFRSKPVDSLAYRYVLVRYIDSNPVSAGLAQAPQLYPYASAWSYAMPAGPPWLERSWVEQLVRTASAADSYGPREYVAAFGAHLASGLSNLVEQRINGCPDRDDPLDALVRGAPQDVLAWMRSKARLADGTRAGLAICDPASIGEAVGRARAETGEWLIRSGHKHLDAWPHAHAGLLRDLAGLRTSEMSQRLSFSTSAVSNLIRRHRAALSADERYSERVQRLAVEALRLCGVTEAAGIVDKLS